MATRDDLDRLISAGPGDADIDYYARQHAGAVTHVVRVGDAAGVVVAADGWLGPLAVLRADEARVVPALLARLPSRRRYLKTTSALADALSACVRLTDPRTMRVSWATRETLRPAPSVDAEIRVGRDEATAFVDGAVASRCRVVWRSRRYAEVAIETESALRRRGLGRAAVAAMSARLLGEGVTPIYVADVLNEASLRLADGLGFKACRETEFAGYADL